MKLLSNFLFKSSANKLIISLLVIFMPIISFGQITIDTTKTAQYLVENILVGAGVSVSNITYTGSVVSLGDFNNGNTTNIGMDEGIILSTGDVTHIAGPNLLPNTQTNTLGGSDPDLASLVTNPIYDAAILEFDFVPMSDTIRFQYVFGSEEYSEWVNTGYNDAFGFFLTGANPSGGTYNSKNLAIVPGTANTIVSINTINNGNSGLGSPNGPCTNCSYYIDNYQGTTIEYDGFTTVLTTWIVVTPCTSYHIKLAIGDGGDHSYDSGVFLKKNSFSSDILNVNTNYTIAGINNKAVEGCNNALVSFTLDNPSPYNRWVHYTVGGTAIEGTDYQNIPDSVLIPTGNDSVSFNINPVLDGITEGVENVELIVETSSCSYDTISIPIYDYDSLEVQINGNTNFCIGQSSTLSTNITDGFGPYSYSWNTGSTSNSITESPNSNTIYTVTATDACGIQDTDNISITVNQQPNITAISQPSSICQGHSAALQVSGASTYSWSPSASLSASSGDSITATPNSTTTYTVIGTDANGCKDTTQTILTVKTIPNIQTAPAATSICIGDSITISANGGISYQWSPSSSLSSNNTASTIAFPSVTTTYTVIGTASNGCQDSTTSIIAVNNLPNVQISPSNPSICIGGSQILHASGGSTYLWSPSSSLSSSSGSTVTATPNTTTTYILEGTDNHNCKNSDTVNITVYSKPNITVAPISVNICEGASTVINASGGSTYSWSPGQGLSSTTGSSVTASPIVNSTYTVTGSDINGCSDTAITHITVSPNPIISATDTVICFGDNTTLSATASLSGTSFVWSTGATNNSINVSPANSTLYHVTATDGMGCVGDDSLNVVVNPLPTLSISPANPSICIGNNITVTASGANTYSWTPTINNSNVNNATTTLSPTSTTVYTVTGVDGNGCVNSTTTNITVNPLPNITVNPDIDSICWGGSTSLTAAGGNTYNWSPAGGLSAVNTATVTASPTVPTNYIVSGTDANGCTNTDTATVFVSPVVNASASPPNICLGDSSNLTVSSNVPSSYLWNTGQTSSSFWVKPTDTTTYTVTVTTAAGCQRVENVVVNVYLRPNVIITPDSSSICAGETTSLTASGAVNYTWQANPNIVGVIGPVASVNPTANDSFIVIGEDLSGCKDTAYAKVTVFPALNISVTPGSITTCQGTPVNLKSSGAISYLWNNSSSLNTNTGDSVIATPNSTTTYKVVGTDANGCKDSVYSTVHINAKPIVSINPDSSDICIGESQSLHASGAFTYTWSPSAGLSNTTGNNTTASPAVTTTYTIIGTSQVGGCKDTATAFVGVHSYPTITLTPAAVQICPQDSTTLTAGGADLYSWIPTLGLSDTIGAVVKAKPDSTQTYTVIGSSIYGCTDTLSSTITVSPIPVISGNNYICSGNSSTLNVVSNLGNTSFLWSTGSTSNSITVSPLTTTTYTVTATDNGSSCTNDTSFVVNVNAIPSLSVSPDDTTICHGTNVLLMAHGASTYSWSPSASLSSSANPVVSASPTSNTTYQLIGTTSAGCKDTVYADVKLFTAVNVNVNPVSSYSCGGGSQLLTATGADTYVWSPSNGLSTTTGSSVLAGPASNTTYTVTGTDTNSCTDTALAHVYIYGNPSISPANPSICPEDSVLLTANTQNNPISYLWSTGESTPSIYASPAATSTISVTVTYPGSCIKSGQTTVTIYTDPSVSASTTTPYICIGDTANLIAQNCSSYSWTGLNLISSTGSNVKSIPNTDTTYIVRGLSSHSCATFDTVDIHIHPITNVSINASQTSICIRDTVLLIGNGAQSYSWQPNQFISVTTGDSTNVYPHSNTSYIVTGIDSNGCSDSDTTLISVNPGPVVTIFPDSPVVCQGDTMDLIASGALTYSWSPLVAITNSNNDTANIFPVSNITYYVRGYDAAGCSNDTSIYVNVRRKPFIGVLPNLDSICSGDSIELTAYGASTYCWHPTNSLSDTVGTNVFAKPASTTTFCVVGRSTDGCTKEAHATINVYPIPSVSATANASICKYDSAQLIATGAYSYQWSPIGNINTNTFGDTANVSPLTTTTYKTVGTTIHGCKDSAYSNVTVYNLPNVQIAPTNPAICYGDSTQLTASGAIMYSWSPSASLSSTNTISTWASPLVNTSIIVAGTDAHNCVNRDTVNLIVHPDVVPTANPSQDSICYGLSTNLSAGGGVSYQWSPATGLSATNTANVIANPLADQTYKVKVYDAFNCVDSINVDVTVLSLPNVQLNSASSGICIYDTTYIWAQGAQSYIWSPNVNLSNLNGDTTYCNPQATQKYFVQGTDSLGCINTDSTIITVYNLPNVQIAPTNPAICYGDSTQLTASGAIMYSWSPSASLSSTNTISTWASPLVNTSIIVAGTDAHNCVNRDTVNLIVHPDVVPTANPSQDSICYGLSTNLSAGGGVSYQWSPATGLSATNTANVIANPLADQTYKVKVYDAFNCVDSINVDVTVLSLPNVQLNAASSGICIYDTTYMWVQGAQSYVWSPNINLNSLNGDTTYCNPLSTQKYFVQGTDSLGCINTDSTIITVYNLPNVQASVQDTAICIGENTVLNAAGAIAYNWYPNTGLSSTTTNQVTTNTTNTIWYYLTGTDANTCVNIDSVEVIVRPRPQLSITTTDSILCSGYYLGLTGHSNMNPTTMIWSTGDTAVTSSDNPTSNTTYQLKGINTYSCADSTTVDILVNPFPILHIQNDTIICFGDSISAQTTCNLMNLTYLWNTGDTSLCIPFHPYSDSTYTLVATDSIGCSDTISTTIRVQSKAGLNITANSTHICSGSLLTLTANTIYPVSNYQWNIGNATISNNYYPTSNSSFNVIATDSIGCNYYDSIDIQVNPIPVIQANSQPGYICIGDSAQLSVTSSVNPINIFWSNTGQTSQSINVSPTQTTTYNILAADSIGCVDTTAVTLTVYNLPILQISPTPAEICYGDSIQLLTSSNNTITSYIWNDNNQQANNWVSPQNTSIFSVTATDNHGCVNDTQKIVVVHPNPIIQINPTIDTICSYDSTQLVLSSNIPAQNILWSNGSSIANPYFKPMVSTYYSSILTDTNGCFGYDTAFVYVIPRPTSTFTAQSPICSIDSSRVKYLGTGTSMATANWDFGTANSVSGSGLSDHYSRWNKSGIYQITLDVTENGCTSFPDTALVTVFDSPEVEISAIDTSVCDSFAVDFTGLPSGMASYLWNFGDPLALGADTSNLQNPSYTYTSGGSYGVSLSVISPDGCPAYVYQNSMIDVHPVPVADFIVDPQVSYSNNPIIHFYDKSSVNVNYWEWDFGNPQSGIYNNSNNQNPYHIYQTKGTFFTQLVVKNKWGCSDTAYNQVIIENGPTFYIPDAFTPNGDGLNDVFIPKGTDFIKDSYEIYIYERWGSKVFESHDYNHQWDGKHYKTGQELPDGVYSYIIYVIDIHDVKRKFVGSITMFR
jgi:gliding motility-associated-like protein